MTVVAFVVVVVLVAVLMGGVSLLLVSTAADPTSPWAIVAVIAASSMLLGALLLGSLRAYWVVDASQEARTLYRRLLVGVIVAAIAATGVLLWAGIELRSPWWVVAAATGLSVAPIACAPAIGDAFRRRTTHPGAGSDSELDGRLELGRTIRVVATTFVIASIAAVIVLVLLVRAFGDDADPPGLVILQAAGLGFVAAGIAGTIRSLPANRRLRAITRGDMGLARRFGRAVFRGKPEEFTDEERAVAVEYAKASMIAARLSMLALPLLLLGLALQNVTAIVLRPDDSQLQIVVVGVLVASLAIVAPLAVLQRRRTRQFLDTHDPAKA